MKKRKLKKTFVGIIIIVLFAILGFLIYKVVASPEEKEVKEHKIVSKIDDYGYKLKENKPKAYKDMFKELEEILKAEKVDEEAYAKKISEMFIYDFYSLDDKDAKTDVGGVDFVYQGALDNFLQNAQNTYYKYVESNIYGNRNQKLPIVKDINVTGIEQAPFAYGDKTDESAYSVTVTWDYTDTQFATYQKAATLKLIHEEKKLSIVELQ
ncbi:MAG: hypothetical protein IKF71_01995 [Bacilli bacterium]|nr:hypothetical protein [Bacilli bacterium]